MKLLRLQAGLWGVLLFLSLVAATFFLLPLPEPWVFAPQVEPGSPASPVLLDARERHEYKVQIGEGQLLDLSVEQRGLDVALELFTPSGEPWLEVDSPIGAEKAERIVAVAPAAGTYRLSVSEAGNGSRGEYVLKVGPLRSPTPQDRKLAASVLALSHADRSRKREEWQEAILKYHEVLRLSQEAGDLDRHAFAQRRLGSIYHDRGDDEKALKLLRQASEELRGLGYRLQEAAVLDSMGRIHFERGYVRSALDLYQASLRIYRAIGGEAGRNGEATLLNGIALAYKYLGKPGQASTSYLAALDRWPSSERPEERAVIVTNIGELLLDLRRPDQALVFFDQALLHLQSDLAGRARALAGRGIANADLKKPDEAFNDLKEAQDLAHRSGKIEAEVPVLNRLGQVVAGQRQAEQAVTLLLDALKRSRQARNLWGEARALAQLGASYLLLKNFEQAFASFEQASDLFRKLQDRSSLSSTLLGAAQAKHALGDLGSAQAWIEEAIAIYEELRKEPLREELRLLYLSKRPYYETLVAVLIDRAKKEPEKGFEAKAFEASERARARTVLDELAGSNAGRDTLDPQTLENERKLKDAVQERWRRSEPGSNPEASREAEALEARIREQAADRVLRTAKDDALRTWSRPLTLQEIQQQVLDEKTLLLSFSLGENRSSLFLVGPRSLKIYPLPPRHQIEEHAESLAAELARRIRRSPREIKKDLAALSYMLLREAAGELAGKRLLIVPDGALYSIPFAALPDPGSLREGGALQTNSRNLWDYPALVDFHALDVLPSASVLGALRRTAAGRPVAPLEIAVLGDPVFEKDDPRVLSALSSRSSAGARDLTFERFRRLEFSGDEAFAILNLFPPERRLQAVGFSATRDLILDGRLDQYRILHFATHGVLDDQPELSGLVFSQVDEKGREIEGFLPAFEISRLHLPCELVVLSACQTSTGEVVPGEGALNLSRSFLAAGAQRVVGTLWKVDDEATSKLMVHFYRAMSRGSSPSEALRAAQIAMRNDERWSSPYFWSGFVLQGEW